ncbi:MAG: dihydroorotate dehydrogenase electron transfer subunit [Armatimonadetes bacterium]|nr:dihydroorotate dehydrogenase electron transfer subunit [Armatimonadota bacterium]
MKGIFESEIIEQKEVAPGVVRAILTGPEIARDSRAGQFLNVHVAQTTDPLLRRPFSVHAVYPDQGVYSLLYVMVGRGTALLNKLRPGDKVSVVGPLGRPFDLGDSPDAQHIVVAGGCGAAPLHFLCDALCAKWGCDNVRVLTGGRSKNAVLCEAEFRAHGVEVGISTDDGTYGFHGVVTQLLERYLVESGEGEPPGEPARREPRPPVPCSQIRIYSCGPHPMMKEVARIAREAGVASCQLSLENNMACGIGVCMGCVQKIRGAMTGDKSGRDWHRERVCADGPVFNAEDVIWE